MSLVTIGIDNGISGAICALGQCGQIIAWTATPSKMVDGKNEVDTMVIRRWMAEHDFWPANTQIIIEKPVGAKSYNAAVSMAGCFQALRASLEVRSYVIHRVSAKAWQTDLMGKSNGNTKPKALAMAKQLWPDERWLDTPRCKTANDGAVDAALIAHWWQKKNQTL